MDIGTQVRTARKALGYTQQELADELDLDLGRDAIIDIEANRRSVKAGELYRLARTLERPLEYFLSEPAPDELATVAYRGDVATRDATRAELWLRRHLQDFEAIGSLMEEPPTLQYAPISSPDAQTIDAANASAGQQRELLGLGTEPIADIRSVLEEKVGVPVFGRAVDDDQFLGMLLFAPDQPLAAILVNAKTRTSRRNFSMAHEWGHLVWKLSRGDLASDIFYRNEPNGEEEMFANVFAAQVLVPDDGIENFWEQCPGPEDVVSPEGVQKLASRFGVSFQVMTYRLQNTELLSAQEADELRQHVATWGCPYHRNEWCDLAAMSPLYQCHVIYAYVRGGLSAAKCANMLDVTAAAFVELVDEAEAELPQEATIAQAG